MTEDPRDERPRDRDVSGADQSPLDELDQGSASPPGDEADDEILLEELDVDGAGFFEVSAVGGREDELPPEQDSINEAEMYEVQAAPGVQLETDDARTHSDPATSQRPTQHFSVASGESESIRRLQNVEVEVVATLGTTRMQIKDILGLHVGSVVELHRLVGEPIDVTLNGRLIARGEVVVVDEKFAIRVNEIAASDE